MRRAINTIKKEEYNQLLKEAAQRMSKAFLRMCEEEDMKMREADDKGNFDKAEKHDFNARALMCMADMYYKLFNLDNVDSIVNLNKVWHDASEKQKEKEHIVVVTESGSFTSWYVSSDIMEVFRKYNIVKWAYSEDLLPTND